MRYGKVILIVALAVAAGSASATPTIFEAEDAVSSGPALNTTQAGYSGTGAMFFNAAGGTGVTFSVFSAGAGQFPISFRYLIPAGWGDKWNALVVNGVVLPDWATGENWHIKFPNTGGQWAILEYPTPINLVSGANTIIVRHDWGWIYLDYIAIDGLARQARNPVPANHAIVPTSLSQICWTNPDPNMEGGVITSDVYLGTGDPNENLPGYGYTKIASGITETCVTIPFALEQTQTYRWVVNCFDSSMAAGEELLPGSIWDFNTNNAAPVVNVGPNQYLWLGNAGDPATATVSVDATVTDDGLPPGSTLSKLWTQVSGPAEVIGPDGLTSEDISLVLPALGQYEFRLTASDTDLAGSDNVVVGVFATPCAAAQAAPGYARMSADIDGDCYVGLNDLAEFAMQWLECNSLAPCR